MEVPQESFRETYSEIYESIELLEKGDPSQSVTKIAKRAVSEESYLGLLGTVESSPIHSVRPGRDLLQYDRNIGIWMHSEVDAVYITDSPEVAIMCALFGDMNVAPPGQRALLNKPLTTKPSPHFGWEAGHFDSDPDALIYFARPELIRAARKLGSTVLGHIDIVRFEPEQFRRLDIQGVDDTVVKVQSKYISLGDVETVASIPVRGMDLPKAVIPTNFEGALLPPETWDED